MNGSLTQQQHSLTYKRVQFNFNLTTVATRPNVSLQTWVYHFQETWWHVWYHITTNDHIWADQTSYYDVIFTRTGFYLPRNFSYTHELDSSHFNIIYSSYNFRETAKNWVNNKVNYLISVRFCRLSNLVRKMIKSIDLNWYILLRFANHLR